MSLMHMKKRYRLDSGGCFYPSIMELSPPASDADEEDDQQKKLRVTPFTKVVHMLITVELEIIWK